MRRLNAGSASYISLFCFCMQIAPGSMSIVPQSVSVVVGQRMEMECRTAGNGTKVREWTVRKIGKTEEEKIWSNWDGDPNRTSPNFTHFKVELSVDGTALISSNSIRFEDAGNYSCSVQTGNRQPIKFNAKLTVVKQDDRSTLKSSWTDLMDSVPVSTGSSNSLSTILILALAIVGLIAVCSFCCLVCMCYKRKISDVMFRLANFLQGGNDDTRHRAHDLSKRRSLPKIPHYEQTLKVSQCERGMTSLSLGAVSNEFCYDQEPEDPLTNAISTDCYDQTEDTSTYARLSRKFDLASEDCHGATGRCQSIYSTDPVSSNSAYTLKRESSTANAVASPGATTLTRSRSNARTTDNLYATVTNSVYNTIADSIYSEANEP